MNRKWLLNLLCLVALALMLAPTASARRHKKSSGPQVMPLSGYGRQLEAQYTTIFRQLQSQIAARLPKVDLSLEKKFMTAYAAENTFTGYPSRKNKGAYNKYKSAVSQCLKAGAPLLQQMDAFLANGSLDNQLIKASVIANATPNHLAAFAQQSQANQQLIEKLLSDPALMKQIQYADGPLNNNYGRTMQIYEAIQHASSEAHDGILQRLALGTALQQHPLHGGYGPGKHPVYNPVTRFLNYQKAYDKHELDPHFPIMTTWECRFITNDPFSDQEITWFRKMLRNYEPSYITMNNPVRRYLQIVHSDVGYRHPTWNAIPGSFAAKVIGGGGECGPRAWIGRLAERSFGIPTWGVQQPGHAALSHWTPSGWVTHLGAGMEWSKWMDRCGVDFHLESQARWHPKQYMKVLRAQWIGDVLLEPKADPHTPGGTGGFWAAVANCEKHVIANSGKPTRVIPSEGQLARKFGPTMAQKLEATVEPASSTKITGDAATGVIHIPAVAYSSLKKQKFTWATNTKSYLGGYQLQHTMAKGLEYTLNIPPANAGKYSLVAKYVDMNVNQHLQLTVKNEDNAKNQPVDISVPWTDGMWQTSKPVIVTLAAGPNLLRFDRSSKKAAGITLKNFTLTPVK